MVQLATGLLGVACLACLVFSGVNMSQYETPTRFTEDRFAMLKLFFFGLTLVTLFLGSMGDQNKPEYPAYNEVPQGLSFSCNQRPPGYYADPDAQCQVWHWCLPSGQKFSFLCPNGTVFNQLYRVCDWYFNVDCPASQSLYGVNDDLYKDSKGNPI